MSYDFLNFKYGFYRTKVILICILLITSCKPKSNQVEGKPLALNIASNNCMVLIPGSKFSQFRWGHAREGESCKDLPADRYTGYSTKDFQFVPEENNNRLGSIFYISPITAERRKVGHIGQSDFKLCNGPYESDCTMTITDTHGDFKLLSLNSVSNENVQVDSIALEKDLGVEEKPTEVAAQDKNPESQQDSNQTTTPKTDPNADAGVNKESAEKAENTTDTKPNNESDFKEIEIKSVVEDKKPSSVEEWSVFGNGKTDDTNLKLVRGCFKSPQVAVELKNAVHEINREVSKGAFTINKPDLELTKISVPDAAKKLKNAYSSLAKTTQNLSEDSGSSDKQFQTVCEEKIRTVYCSNRELISVIGITKTDSAAKLRATATYMNFISKKAFRSIARGELGDPIQVNQGLALVDSPTSPAIEQLTPSCPNLEITN